MKKAILLAFLIFFPSFALAEVPSGVMGFMDGKLYNTSTNALAYICFMDGNCYDKDMKFAFNRGAVAGVAIPSPLEDTKQKEREVQVAADLSRQKALEEETVLKKKEAEYNKVCIQDINDLQQKVIDLKTKFYKDLENYESSLTGTGRTEYSAEIGRRAIQTQFSKDMDKLSLQIEQKNLECKKLNVNY